MYEYNDWKDHLGKTIKRVEGLSQYSDLVKIILDDGEFVFEHFQNCCESVWLEDFEGSEEDLVNQKLVSIEESSGGSSNDSSNYVEEWTYYIIRTTGGDLTLRWLGSSNGYYSTAVNLRWQPSRN